MFVQEPKKADLLKRKWAMGELTEESFHNLINVDFLDLRAQNVRNAFNEKVNSMFPHRLVQEQTDSY